MSHADEGTSLRRIMLGVTDAELFVGHLNGDGLGLSAGKSGRADHGWASGSGAEEDDAQQSAAEFAVLKVCRGTKP